MDLTALMEYMSVAIVGICLCVGYMLKNAVNTDKINRYIPLIMGLLGLFINLWLNKFNITAEVILGGLVSGLASTGLYEAFHQFLNREE